MSQQTAESTQIALVQLTVQQMKENLTQMASDIREIKNSKYITQNDLQIARAEDRADVERNFKTIGEKMDQQTKTFSDKFDTTSKIGMLIGGGVILTIIGAVMKLILKV